jgi:hypothetical protein
VVQGRKVGVGVRTLHFFTLIQNKMGLNMVFGSLGPITSRVRIELRHGWFPSMVCKNI